MTSRTAGLALLAVLLLVIGGGATAYVLFLKGDDVAPLALSTPGSGASATGAGSSAGGASSATAATLAPAGGSPLAAAAIPGTWAVGADSIVGYRVRERLASLSADSDAVGRTSSITGSATIASSGGAMTVSAADFSVDMTSIASDKSMRDRRLRNDGIQTDQFPTSTFKLTQPATVPAAASSGSAVDVTLHGDLTLHGVTKTIDIPAKAQLSGSVIQVVGSYAFPFSDFQINAPNIGGFVAVEDHGTLEFKLNLTKS